MSAFERPAPGAGELPRPDGPPPSPPLAGQATVVDGVAVIREGVVAHPGDTLIIGVSDAMSPAEVRELQEDFSKYIPGLKIAVVDGVTALAVFRPAASGG